MIGNLTINRGCYAIQLTAEDEEEAAKLVDFGLNSTKEIRSKRTHVCTTSESADSPTAPITIGAVVVFGKKAACNQRSVIGG
jgi:hypothetical protein